LFRLVFCTKEKKLKLRLAQPADNFSNSYCWKNKIEFILTDQAEMTMAWTSLLPDLEPHMARALVDLVSARYPVSEDYQALKKLCSDLVFKNDQDEWVFYGGTFNPWHQGHQSCLELLPKDKVCLVLPDRNPQKELLDLEPVFKILEISNRARFKPLQFLVPTFLLLTKKNPTIDWIKTVKALFPHQKISLLMGFDSFKNIQSWVQAEELLQLVDHLYVVSRMESHTERSIALSEIPLHQHKVIFLGQHPFEHLSSSDLRKKSV
jgi:nicotinic acid mononucleotide adenylyltransferase